MNREKIENLLKEKIENYEELYTAGKEYVREHEADLKERFRYAYFLEKPLNEKQALFWNGNECSFDGEPREIYGHFREQYGDEFTYIWVIKDKKPKDAEEGITWVKKNSVQYWEALAVSGYLAGSGNLPVPFLKRKGQKYLGVPRKPEKEDIDSRSLYVKELFKLDEHLGGRSRNELLKEMGFCRPDTDNRKKVLVLVNWKEEREHRYVIREMLKRADVKKYDITVATPRVMSECLEREFEDLSDHVQKFIYRGRMTVTEKDFLLLRILEKRPQLLAEEEEIRDYLEVLMKAEWERIWGEQTFDCVVLAGKMTSQQYFMACASVCGKKILVDMEFLAPLRNREEQAWEKAVSVFEERYTLPLWKNRENLEPEKIKLEGKEYLICDTWTGEDHRIMRKLVSLNSLGEAEKSEFTEKYLPMYPWTFNEEGSH